MRLQLGKRQQCWCPYAPNGEVTTGLGLLEVIATSLKRQADNIVILGLLAIHEQDDEACIEM